MMKCFDWIYGMHFELRGLENLDIDEPCVVICNHQSIVDVSGMMEIWPHLKRCVSMQKKELRFAFTFGIVSMLCGTVYIDRQNPERAHETVKRTVQYLRSKNTKVWIFPEGTRNNNGSMLPFKKGAFHMAIQGQLPIIPLVFSNYSQVYSITNKVFQPGRVIITALPVVRAEPTEDVNELIERVRTSMLEVYNQIPVLESAVENGTTSDKKHS